MTRVAVVIPTVAGRETLLGRSVAAHAGEARTVHVLKGYPSCGAAWNSGALLALADPEITHVLLSADDLIPTTGWSVVAERESQAGFLPAPRLFNADGGRWDSDGENGELAAFPRVPFLSAWLLRRLLPIPPLHYYSDCWVGSVAGGIGWASRMAFGFDFVHLWAPEGRIHDSEPDRVLYETLMARQ